MRYYRVCQSVRAGIVVSGTYAWKDKWQYMDSLIELAMKEKTKKKSSASLERQVDSFKEATAQEDIKWYQIFTCNGKRYSEVRGRNI